MPLRFWRELCGTRIRNGKWGVAERGKSLFCFAYSPGENGVGLAGKVLEVDYGEQGKDCGEKTKWRGELQLH